MDSGVRILTALAARFMVARYLLASASALMTDMIVFLALSHGGASPMMAALGGYAAGLIVHWVISIRFVFDTRGGATHGQLMGFVATALLGLGMTMGIVGSLSAIGLPPAVAKLFSVPVSFFTVYAARKYGVFARA
ncbi:GtrA family protein [Sphingobium sp. AN558]|uniref:GtrA family protein n=1 Tax=Sphingobium sp. AN558 TaxID=3133442 RepID=UPI0030C20B58